MLIIKDQLNVRSGMLQLSLITGVVMRAVFKVTMAIYGTISTVILSLILFVREGLVLMIVTKFFSTKLKIVKNDE